MKKITFILLFICMWIFIQGEGGIVEQTSSAPDKKTTSTKKNTSSSKKDLGSKSNPVKCDKASGEEEYLKRLRDKNGNPVIYKRIGHSGPTPASHYLDKYEIKSKDGKHRIEIYMDMYYQGRQETKAVKGFTMAPSTTAALKQKTKAAPPKSKPPVKQVFSPDKIPGFDDVPNPQPKKKPALQKSTAVKSVPPEDKIPGFDDVPDPPKTTHISPPASQFKRDKKYLSLVTLPYKQKVKKSEDIHHEVLRLINNTIQDAFDMLKKTATVTLSINQKGHTIHDKRKLVKEFFDICRGKEDETRKMEKLKKQILEPQEVDVVVAAVFHRDKNTKSFIVSPMIASKPDNKLSLEVEFVYNYNKKHDDIKKDLEKRIVDLILGEFPAAISSPANNQNQSDSCNNGSPDTSKTQVYFSFIPLDVPATQPPEEPKSLAELLNEVIDKGVTPVKNRDQQLVVNQNRHTIHKDDAAVKNLNNILLKSKLRDNQKAGKIINEIMNPRGIDFIYVTQLTENNQNSIVNVHLYMVSKPKKRIFSMNLIFQRDELVCKDVKTRLPMICREADDNIVNAVQIVLDQALK